jgi:chaperonin cofactor prefoldin
VFPQHSDSNSWRLTAKARLTPLIWLLNRLVLETLEPLSGDRKCFRLVNGVLVERTVKDVIPAIRTNSEGLKKVLDDLVKQYKAKQDELEKWKVRFHPCYVT